MLSEAIAELLAACGADRPPSAHSPDRAGGIATRSEADDPIGVGDQTGDVGWRHPGPADRSQVIVGDRTGHRASLSDKHRERAVPGLRDQLPEGRDPDAGQLIATRQAPRRRLRLRAGRCQCSGRLRPIRLRPGAMGSTLWSGRTGRSPRGTARPCRHGRPLALPRGTTRLRRSLLTARTRRRVRPSGPLRHDAPVRLRPSPAPPVRLPEQCPVLRGPAHAPGDPGHEHLRRARSPAVTTARAPRRLTPPCTSWRCSRTCGPTGMSHRPSTRRSGGGSSGRADARSSAGAHRRRHRSGERSLGPGLARGARP